MRQIVALSTVLLVAFAFVTGLVFAAGAEEETGEGTMGTPQSPPGVEGPMPTQLPIAVEERAVTREGDPMAVLRADAIIGLAVLNEEGERVGKVEDLTLSEDGRITYLVISRGGVLGFGSKAHAIPWGTTNIRIHERALIVELTKEQFESAPTFENWADLTRDDYEQEVRAYYGEEPGFEGQEPKAHPEEISPGEQPGMPSEDYEPGAEKQEMR